ncbi:MAG TPA: hypothetical protein VIM70_05860 [Clostridium sp.]|uniref:hypothetical protein n=1 Tax=Clostridium sp. TaxID=1506 RepID=UPI002F956B1C
MFYGFFIPIFRTSVKIASSDIGEKVVIKKFKPSIFKKNSEKNVYEAVILSKLVDKRIPEFLGVINQNNYF